MGKRSQNTSGANDRETDDPTPILTRPWPDELFLLAITWK